jgi:hypothetical protein
MKTTTLVAIVAVSAAAALCTTEPASANPVVACQPHGAAAVTGQKVVVSFEVGVGPAGDIYRAPVNGMPGPGMPNNVQVTDVSTSASSADMGSGVEGTTLYTATDPCAPVGEWAYHMVVNGQSVCGAIVADVTTADPACAAAEENADDDGSGGCAIAAERRSGSGMSTLLLGALGLIGLASRRRR